METVGRRREPRRWGVFGRVAAGAPDRRVVPGLYGIRVEERFAAGAYTVRAELPGIDADRDLEVSIADGRLFLLAERRRGATGTAGAGDRGRAGRSGYSGPSGEPGDPGYQGYAGYSEFRYGAFARALRLPPGARGTEATVRYENGVVTVTVPCRGREPRTR